MTTYRLLILILCFCVTPAGLACSCVPPTTVTVAYAEASTVVAAEAVAVSDRTVKDENGHDLARQAVLWQVHESWKGPHKLGSKFTTRTLVDCCICGRAVTKSDLMILYLQGKEPYKLSICGRSDMLKLSLQDVPLLYEFRGSKP